MPGEEKVAIEMAFSEVELRMVAIKFSIQSFHAAAPDNGKHVLERAEIFKKYLKTGEIEG